MPFLTVDPASARQRFLRGVATYPRCMGAVAGALGLLPHWLKVDKSICTKWIGRTRTNTGYLSCTQPSARVK